MAINVNENPYPVPDAVVRDILTRIGGALPGLNRYPDREFTALREHLADYLAAELGGAGRILPQQIWAANGSNEVLQQLLQAFAGAGRSVLGFVPTYSMYPLLARGVDSTWIAGKRDARVELPAASAVATIRGNHPNVVILRAPNNPPGTPLALDVIAAVADAADGLVIVDEAYAEFRPDGEPSALELLPGRPRLVVSRTMSKAFAFAGARLGYFAADPAVADAVRLVRLPYHLSAITQAAAVAALEHRDTMLAQVERIRAQRDRLVEELAGIGFRPARSSANFVQFGGVADPDRLFHLLWDRGILIRDNGIPHSLRVTAGSETETTRFLDAVRDILAAEPGLLGAATPGAAPSGVSSGRAARS